MPEGTDNNDRGGAKINIGATGVEKEKITFRHGRTCGMGSAWKKSETQIRVLEKLLGRQPNLFYAEYGVTGIHIFGERINTDISKDIEMFQKKTPEGFEPSLWNKHIRYMPGGVF